MAVTTQPERREITTRDIPALIADSADARKTIAPFLPEGVSLDRVAASLRVALARDRAAWKKEGLSPLERCSPMSVFMAVAKIMQWGLEVGETAHLVPYGVECVPIADYKGLAQLVIGSGVVRHVEAHCVYEKEPFTMRLGTQPTIEHHPIWSPKERGPMIGAYAIFDLRGGRVHIKFMGVDEIDAIRQRYSKQWKEGALQPWYAEKTVIRQGVKLLPKDPRLARTLALLEQTETELPIEVPAALRELASGTYSHTLPDEREGPKALANAGVAGYGIDGEVPVAPGSVNDHAEADRGRRDEPFEGAGGETSVFDAAAPIPAAPEKPQHPEGGPACPTCAGPMWDNRAAKRNPKAPDFKCKSRECEGVLWPAKDGEVRDETGTRRRA